MNFWDQIRNYLQQRISQEGYDNWLKGTSFAGIDGDTIFVTVPDRETRAWLETEYAGLVRNAIRELGLPVQQVSYEPQPERSTSSQTTLQIEPADGEGNASSLNPKFTFGSFV